MKKITLQGVLDSLKNLSPQVEVSEDVRLKAKATLDRMLDAASKEPVRR